MAEPVQKMERKAKYYPEVDGNPDFAKLEEKILKLWQDKGAFEQSIEQRDKAPEFIFYDGPPFANGLPHYGHLLTGYVKDIFARYQTMKGKKVERRFGWDCHGLPAEMAAEKELSISGRVAIEAYGIAKFNEYCRSSVMKYTNEWKYYVNRQARWVDFDNDYKTMDLSYMESVTWAFKQLYDKGLLYESFRVMPYSWACETPLSNFETRMDNSYRERTDKAITVAFELNDKPQGAPEANKYYLLAWTTTPWTLPSNLALGVSKKIKYAAVVKDGNCYIFAVFAAKNYAKEFGKISEDGKSHALPLEYFIEVKNLIDLTYKPLFPYFEKHQGFRVLSADFIEEGSGTGVVHLAPGFGEDDQKVCEANQIGIVCPVDSGGRFTTEIYDIPYTNSGAVLKLSGLNVIAETNGKEASEPYKDDQVQKYGLANLRIINWLKESGNLIGQEDIKHNYPHCWRTDTPLIYRALPSWYVEVTKFKDRMVELNQQINWIPGHIKDGRFGKWLEGARDWSISRNRFWGAPIPVWRSDDPKYPNEVCLGSLDEIEKYFGIRPKDLHRPVIDKLTKPNPKDPTGKSMMRRVPDVLDCWFESGSMPFAQVHYPFENKAWFESHFPADFIVEYEAQTRGWFYTLMVLGTALFDKPPFKNCICHGVVLDDKGEKLSKRLNNYVDPKAIFNSFGSDSLRWMMCSSPIMHGNELHIDKEGKFIRDIVRLYIKPMWNSYNFFTLYANSDGIKAEYDTSSQNLMDRYILTKCHLAVDNLERHLDAFDTPAAYREIEQFFEALNNWHIRRSRQRFWKTEKDNDKQQAYNTLYSILHIMCRAAAPLLPFITEEVWQGLNSGKSSSVHLERFPSTTELPLDEIMVELMDRVRDICNAALSIRSSQNIRVRQPLGVLKVIGNDLTAIKPFAEIIKDEVNVKQVEFDNNVSEVADYKLQINFPIVGKRLPAKVKEIIPAGKQGKWKKLSDGSVEIAGETLTKDECAILLEPKNKTNCQALFSQDAVVVLDLTITPDLLEEGIARDVIRMIQQSRKDANLNVSDHINLVVEGPDEVIAAVMNNQEYIKDQTLADALFRGKVEDQQHSFSHDMDERKVLIGFSVV